MFHFTIAVEFTSSSSCLASLCSGLIYTSFSTPKQVTKKKMSEKMLLRLEPQLVDGWLLVHSSKMSLCSPLRVMAHSKRPSPVLPHWCCTTVKATPLSVIIAPHREWSAWRFDRSKSINDIKEIKGRLQLEQRWIDSVQKRQILKKY